MGGGAEAASVWRERPLLFEEPISRCVVHFQLRERVRTFLFLFLFCFFFCFFLFKFLRIHILVTLFVFEPPPGFCLKSSSSVSDWSLTDSDGLLDFWIFAAKVRRKLRDFILIFFLAFKLLGGDTFSPLVERIGVCDVYSLTHSLFSLMSPP